MHGPIPYDAQTLHSSNPLARFAHRNRLRRCIRLAMSRLPVGRVLDYGCGPGVFVSAVLAERPDCAVGYEPFMSERLSGRLPIFSTLAEIEQRGPYRLITLFETLEHLSDEELGAFLELCRRNLAPAGGILISVPIEIGPALILKAFNRSLRRSGRFEYGLLEFLKAVFLGIPARRANDIKTSHKGFDFRRARRALQMRGWETAVLSYGPLPLGTWYGNSQVYLWCTQRTTAP